MLNAVFSRELHGQARIQVDVHESVNELNLTLSVVSDRRRGDHGCNDHRFVLRIRVAPPVSCEVNGSADFCLWDMVGPNVCGVFADAVDWALERLGYDPFALKEDATARADRASLMAAARLASDRAIAICEPRARQLALGFHCGERWFIYGALLADTTGRVEQMVDVCPGLLLLIADRPTDRTIDGIRRGDPCSRLIRTVLPESNDTPNAATLVRRAPKGLFSGQLHLVVAPRASAPNDMPATAAQRLIWYDCVADSRRETERRCSDDRDRHHLGGFVSKHALELVKLARLRGAHPHELFGEILDWIEFGNGTVPSRRSSPERVLRAVDVWHASLRNSDFGDAPLAVGPVAEREIAGVRATQIKTVSELVQESETMRHCVVSRARDARAGRLFIYRGIARGQRVTIAIARVETRWRLVQAAGFANRLVAAPDLIDRWVDSLASAEGAS